MKQESSESDAAYRQDFETPGIPVVDYWDLVRDPAYAHYNKAFLAKDGPGEKNAHGGVGYLILRTLGGNTAFQSSRALIDIDPASSYRLRGWVRTRETTTNRAFVSLRWLDKLGILIGEEKSNSVGRTDVWTEINVECEAPPPAARYVQIRLNMEGEDIRGEAWFDDLVLTGHMIILADAPRHPGNIFAVDEEKRLTFTLPAADQRPMFSFMIRDATGATIAPMGGETAATSPKGIDRTFDLTKPGYYEITVRASMMSGSKRRSADKIVPLLVVERDYFRKEERRDIGVTINPFLLETERLPLLIKTLGAEKAKVALWAGGVRTSAAPPDMGEILRLLKMLWMENVQMIGILSKPSPSQPMGKGLPFVSGGVIALFSQPKERWGEQFTDLVRRTTDYLRLWQIGTDDEREPTNHPEAARTLKTVDLAIKEVKTFSHIGIPITRDDRRRPAGVPCFLAIDTGDADLEAFERLAPSAGEEAHYILRLATAVSGGSGDGYSISRVAQMTDLVKKYVLMRKAGISDVYIPLESDTFQGLLDNNGLPVSTFLCVRTLNKLLSGTAYEERHLFTGPVRDFIFRKGNDRVIVLWNDGGEVEKEIYLGDSARIVEPTGAVSPMPLDRPIKIGPLPTFIIDVDSRLLETVLSLQLNSNDLPLSGAPATRTLQFANKFPADMKGVNIAIKKTGRGWFVKPLLTRKETLKPGEMIKQEMSFLFPPTERDGITDAVIEVSFSVDKNYKLKVIRQIRLVPELNVRAEFPEKSGSTERALKMLFANDSDRIVNAKALIKIPGVKTLEVSFAGLLSKSSRQVDMPIPNYAAVRGQKIVVKFFETNGNLFVNREFVIP